ncbi:MAG: DUF748 domain-containing protein [Burkholderiaceae bacterium]|nr:DUF748 domain-containing protein [Pseudomonadota bacterium]MBS0597348.1 DUF748 domain-containing protein [Pseudomonadota bacterium]MCP5218050.1 DUF748 domain-containing protein [Burkholderiaceae bacterium]
MPSKTEIDEAAQPTPPAAAPPARRAGWRRWGRRLLWAVGALLLLWGLLWLAVPPLLKWQGQKIASEQLGRPVRIGQVEFKPWSLELTVHDLAVGGLAGAPDQLSVKRIYLNAAVQSLWRLGPVLDALQVDAPALRLTHTGEGHYDIDDILARLTAGPAPAQPSRPLRFALYNIVLQDGRVDFDDRAVGRVQQLRDLRLALPFISNLPKAREVKVQPQLAFSLNGSRFDSQAQALPFDDSRHTDASLRLSQFDLKPYLGYLPAGLPLTLQAGVVDADLRLAFEQTPQPALRVTGSLALSDVKAADRQGAPALAFDALKLKLADLQPLARELHLASVEWVNPHVAVHRGADGRINLLPADAPEKEAARAEGTGASGQKSLKKPAAPSASTASTASSPAAPADGEAFKLRIDQVAVHGASVDWRDDSTASEHAPAAAAQLDKLELQAEAIAWPLQQPFDFKGSTVLAGAVASVAAPAAAPAKPAPQGRQATTRAARGKKGAKAQPPAGPKAKAAAPAHAGPASIQFAGRVGAAQGEVGVQVAGVPLALAGPYLAPYLVPRLAGTLGADARLQWALPKSAGAAPTWSVAAKRVQLDQLQWSGEGAPQRRPGDTAPADELAHVDALELADVQLDPQARAVTVGRLAVQGPRVQVERDAQQHFMFERWLRQPEGKADSKPDNKSERADAPWAVRVNELAVAGGTVGWRDEAMPRPVRAEITELKVDARKLDLAGKQPAEVQLSARLGTGRRSGGEPGRLSWNGSVAWAPLAARGAVDVQRLPLQAFEPYFGQQLNIRVLRADTGFKGRVDFAETERGPRVRVEGDARVDELRTYSQPGTAVSVASAKPPAATASGAAPAAASQAPLAPVAARGGAGGLGEELLSWKQLRLDGLDVQLAPGQAPQVAIGSSLLSDFFARIAIDPSGRINLQDIVKSDGQAPPASPAPATAAADAANATVSGEFNAAPVSAAPAAAAVARPEPKADPLAPVIRFGPTKLVNGSIDFTDHFIRPNYSADLTALNGSLGAFSSVAPGGAPQMAELALSGTAEGTATLAIDGQVNPLAEPLALDIRAKVSDLDLPPLSPYSVKYAGHGIERGKLSMDVAYKIQPDGQLTATNKLVLNQLEFGEPVAGAPASLPVQLATALLADSQGVIDLDLPISGSLNDPQFSIGPIIFKAIINLIGKAITAPFSLLARALGGGDGGQDLSQVAFAPGSAQLNAKARAQLDKVAKALADRPGLKLTVAGSARLDDERQGARRQRLDELVAAERRSAAPAPAPASAASAPAGAASGAAPAASGADAAIASAPDYPALLKRLYRRADIPGKPRNAIGMLRDIPVPEMEALLMAHIDVDENAMRQLAVQRGVAVKDYLVGKGVAAARLFLGAAQTGAKAASAAAAPASAASADNAAAPKGWVPHAELSLGMK